MAAGADSRRCRWKGATELLSCWTIKKTSSRWWSLCISDKVLNQWKQWLGWWRQWRRQIIRWWQHWHLDDSAMDISRLRSIQDLTLIDQQWLVSMISALALVSTVLIPSLQEREPELFYKCHLPIKPTLAPPFIRSLQCSTPYTVLQIANHNYFPFFMVSLMEVTFWKPLVNIIHPFLNQHQQVQHQMRVIYYRHIQLY